MASPPPSTRPGRSISRLLTVPALALALVATACSGGGDGGSATKKQRAATSTQPTVLSERVSGGRVSDDRATTFDVDGGALTVLVPIGAVSAGTEVELREVTGGTDDLGAVQRAGKVYDLGFRNGTLRANAKISLTFAAKAGDRAASDPAPVGGRWDESLNGWKPVPSDAATDTITVYATAPGRYTWLRWGWDRALQEGAAAVRALVGPATDAPAATVRCTDTDEARSRVDVAVNASDSLAWCVGRENGTDVMHVANTGRVPMALRTKGFGTPRAVREDSLVAAINGALVSSWSPPEGERVRVLAPGDELVLPFDAAETGARAARLELNGIAQHAATVMAAAAFAAGFTAGNAAVAEPLLANDAELRSTLVAALTAPSCAARLGAALNGDTFTIDRLARFGAELVGTCVDTTVTRRLQVAAMQRPEGSLRSSFPSSPPATVRDQLAAAFRTALTPLLQPVGGIGEVGVSARGSGTADPSFTPAGTATPGTPAPVVPVTAAPTTAPAPEPAPIATTTTVAAAPSPTPAPTAPPTTPAPTAPPTTPAPTAPPTTPPPVTSPPTPLSFNVVGTACATNGGGTLTAVSGQFTAGAPYTATLRSPSNATTSSTGTARGDGTIDWTFPCAGKQAGTWTAQVAQDGHTSVSRSFVVNVYDTRGVSSRVDLPVCSGAVTEQGNASPAGAINQTVVLGGRTTINQIGILNREEFRGVVRVLRGSTVLYTANVVGAGSEPVVVDGVGLTIEAQPGDTITLQLAVTQATAAKLNLALNFWRTQADAAPGAEVSLDNTCPWNPKPAVVPGTDIVGWITP